MQNGKVSALIEYRRQQRERIDNSATLAESFTQLKSLSAELTYLGCDGSMRSSRLKYKVNVAHAKSVFRFDCSNRECAQGGYDLTAELADAVAAVRTTATGELTCEGWRTKGGSGGKVRCGHVLHYKLSLGYNSAGGR